MKLIVIQLQPSQLQALVRACKQLIDASKLSIELNDAFLIQAKRLLAELRELLDGDFDIPYWYRRWARPMPTLQRSRPMQLSSGYG